MSRSLLRQLEQIHGSVTYDDAVASVYTAGVAEPTVSGTLEGDLNVLRTLVKSVKGSTNWYDDLGNYFDPTNTDAGNTENKLLNLTSIKNKTLDSKTLLIPISNNNSNAGYTVSGTSTGALLTVSSQYATSTDRTGLPIFASVANSGSYYDEGGSDTVCMVDVYDMSTGNQFRDDSGNIIYGKFHDGADFSGTGDSTDVYVRFYANNAVTDLTTISGTTPSSVGFYYPQRYTMDQLPEGWLRKEFISGVEGDVEIIEDIYNLWQYTGAVDGDDNPQPWNNTTASYLLSSNPSTLKAAIDTINDGIASRLYTEDNYITDGESITASLNALDIALKDVSDAAVSGGTKYTEDVTSDISKNVVHSTPASYTPSSTAGQEGGNMDVYVNGQLLAADTGAAGVNADRDYAETSTSQITFRFKVKSNANIVYVIRS